MQPKEPNPKYIFPTPHSFTSRETPPPACLLACLPQSRFQTQFCSLQCTSSSLGHGFGAGWLAGETIGICIVLRFAEFALVWLADDLFFILERKN